MELLRGKKKKQENTQNLSWQELHAGLKLRNIVHSKRMNELDLRGGYKSQKLVIQRHLGFKSLIPGAAQWKLYTDSKHECWHCSQHILTLFIWTPRIGQLSAIKDQEVI